MTSLDKEFERRQRLETVFAYSVAGFLVAGTIAAAALEVGAVYTTLETWEEASATVRAFGVGVITVNTLVLGLSAFLTYHHLSRIR